ncbi:hypothetical protein SAMN05192562_1011468 [Kosakonia arachidis]|uniref:Uncharacterized protein n=1 Tax=Kosakonia arachidis TaxID=551989 RepID=A0A1I6ZZJ0_9ENTR|nr:hypothetical protein [Kosakonia arachidis]SFT68083.1 hypothetical protein SAMN05192562_1011468 [Kosakonia arachidis]
MKKIALMSAIMAVSFSSMVFADDRPPVPQDQYPNGEHHQGDRKPQREVPPRYKDDKAPRHDERHFDKHRRDHDKKPPMPEDHR